MLARAGFIRFYYSLLGILLLTNVIATDYSIGIANLKAAKNTASKGVKDGAEAIFGIMTGKNTKLVFDKTNLTFKSNKYEAYAEMMRASFVLGAILEIDENKAAITSTLKNLPTPLNLIGNEGKYHNHLEVFVDMMAIGNKLRQPTANTEKMLEGFSKGSGGMNLNNTTKYLLRKMNRVFTSNDFDQIHHTRPQKNLINITNLVAIQSSATGDPYSINRAKLSNSINNFNSDPFLHFYTIQRTLNGMTSKLVEDSKASQARYNTYLVMAQAAMVMGASLNHIRKDKFLKELDEGFINYVPKPAGVNHEKYKTHKKIMRDFIKIGYLIKNYKGDKTGFRDVVEDVVDTSESKKAPGKIGLVAAITAAAKKNNKLKVLSATNKILQNIVLTKIRDSLTEFLNTIDNMTEKQLTVLRTPEIIKLYKIKDNKTIALTETEKANLKRANGEEIKKSDRNYFLLPNFKAIPSILSIPEYIISLSANNNDGSLKSLALAEAKLKFVTWFIKNFGSGDNEEAPEDGEKVSIIKQVIGDNVEAGLNYINNQLGYTDSNQHPSVQEIKQILNTLIGKTRIDKYKITQFDMEEFKVSEAKLCGKITILTDKKIYVSYEDDDEAGFGDSCEPFETSEFDPKLYPNLQKYINKNSISTENILSKMYDFLINLKKYNPEENSKAAIQSINQDIREMKNKENITILNSWYEWAQSKGEGYVSDIVMLERRNKLDAEKGQRRAEFNEFMQEYKTLLGEAAADSDRAYLEQQIKPDENDLATIKNNIAVIKSEINAYLASKKQTFNIIDFIAPLKAQINADEPSIGVTTPKNAITFEKAIELNMASEESSSKESRLKQDNSILKHTVDCRGSVTIDTEPAKYVKGEEEVLKNRLKCKISPFANVGNYYRHTNLSLKRKELTKVQLKLPSKMSEYAKKYNFYEKGSTNADPEAFKYAIANNVQYVLNVTYARKILATNINEKFNILVIPPMGHAKLKLKDNADRLPTYKKYGYEKISTNTAQFIMLGEFKNARSEFIFQDVMRVIKNNWKEIAEKLPK